MVRQKHISATEVAKVKGCSRQSVNKAIKAGKLDFERIGNQNAVIVNKRFEAWKPNPKRQAAGGIRRKAIKKAKRV